MTLFTPQPFRGSPIVLLHYSTCWTGKFCSTASQFNHTANLTFHSSFTSISFNLLHMLLSIDSLLSNCSSLGHLFSQTVWPSLPSPPVHLTLGTCSHHSALFGLDIMDILDSLLI